MKRMWIIAAVLLLGAGAALAHEKEKGEPEKEGRASRASDEGAKAEYSLVQIMHDLAHQMGRIEFGIYSNNRWMIEAGAREIASHPEPKGGLKPYLRKGAVDITEVAESMDEEVHSTALEIAKAAKTAAIPELQEKASYMTQACVACHEMFRNPK